jgi:hypothetical protein
MPILLLLEHVNLELLDELPEGIKTVIIVSNSHLDKTISSLLSSDKHNFEKKYSEAVNEVHVYIAKLAYTTSRYGDSPKIIKQFERVMLLALSHISDTIEDKQNYEARTLTKAIQTLSDYFGIMNNRDSIALGFSLYLNLSVCIIALYKIIRDENNLYQKNKFKLTQRCSKVTNQLKENIEVIKSIEKVEQTIRKSDTYLSKKQLQSEHRCTTANRRANRGTGR